MTQQQCDILIVGASLGGVAAALWAADAGASVVLLEESTWLGGQLAAQGVCTPDENAWVEEGGCSRSWQQLRGDIRAHYRERHTLSELGASQPRLNPGSCWVSRISVEPRVAHALLQRMVSRRSGVHLHFRTRVTGVDVRNGQVRAVFARRAGRPPAAWMPGMVLDATDLGDLLPLAGVDHVVGAESREETGEPDAPDSARPEWIQPITVPFALELRPPGENHAIPPPPGYAQLKALQQYHVLDGAMRGMWGELSWWEYRRVIAAENFRDPAFPCDVAMINTGSNDFKGGVMPTGDAARDAQTVAHARLASRGYIHWLQTECPRADDPGRRGYPELCLRGDWFGTPDGLAPAPYIRESRRILALRTIREQDVVAADSSGRPWQEGPRASHQPDSVGIGHYWLDIHAGASGEPGLFLETRPFQIPLGALVPLRARNLLPACKNIGATHLASGAYRLHPIEWSIGEAAAALAVHCLAWRRDPQDVARDTDAVRQIQEDLIAAGVPVYWWGDLPPGHALFARAQRLAMDGFWPGGDSVLFRPNELLTQAEAAEIDQRLGARPEWPGARLSRGEALEWLASRIA